MPIPMLSKVRDLTLSFVLASSAAVGGCASPDRGPITGEGADRRARRVTLLQSEAPISDAPRDPPSAPPIVFRLQAYQLSVPIGTISRNDAFWKRIDENCLDVSAAENCQRNGVRVGLAPLAEWEYLNGLIQLNPGTASHADTVGREAKNIELEMRKAIPFQTISYFDGANDLRGTSFDRCENIINLSYQPTPRKPGSARISLSPMVRSTRKRLEFSPASSEEREIVFKSDESFYLNLAIDVPANHILVISPTSDVGGQDTILGHQFFIKDEPAEQFEQVILVFPRPTRVDADAAPARSR